MRFLFTLFLAWSASAQLPVIPLGINTAISSSGWNGTPEGMGNMAFHWIYTNLGNPATLPHATNWVDLIQAAPANWNLLGANTKVLNTTTGVLFTAVNGVRDALTNNATVARSGVTGLGTNFSIFAVFRQINNNFGANTMPIFGDFNGNDTYIGNIGAGTDLIMSINGTSATIVKSANTVPIDIYMTWSNGVFWAWTNGIAAVTAQAWGLAGVPWTNGWSVGCKNNVNFNPWHGTLAEVGIWTNLPLTTSTFTPSTIGSVSNLHWYVTNTPVLKTNGVNCIFP